MPAAADLQKLPDPVDTIERLRTVEALARAAGEHLVADALAAVRNGDGRFEAVLKLADDQGDWRRACRARRDRAYRGLFELIGKPKASATATVAENLVRRYETSAWPRDQRAGPDSLPQGDLRRRLLFDILNSGAEPLGNTALRQLIREKRKF